MFTEIAPGVFSVEHRLVEGKNGLVFGRRGVLAIDGFNYLDEGEATADFIRARGERPNRLALTHGHGDHVLGGAPLAEGEVFSHVETLATIHRHLPRWAERAGEPVEALAARVIRPTVTFTDELFLDLGGKTVRLFRTPGHTDDSACAYVLEDRVLFAGDTAVTGIVPAIHDGDSRVLERTLRRLADLGAETLVPGHGPVVQGRAAVREALLWMAEYLAGSRRAVADALRHTDDPETAADAAPFERLVGDRLPADRHGMPRRHRDTVLRIAREEHRARHTEATTNVPLEQR